MERIAAEAGTSRMTLHRQGVSKAEILRALAHQLEADYREAMWPALVADGEPVPTQDSTCSLQQSPVDGHD
jgi:AcrR family transcriptional regulator